MKPLILLCSIALGGCNMTPAQDPPPPVINADIAGHWAGQRSEGRAQVLWHSHLTTTGKLEIEFWTCFNGQRMRWQRQTGQGGLRDGVFETRIELQEYRGPDDEDVVVTDSGFDYDYRVTELTQARMRYESDEFDTKYLVERVDAAYQLACPPATITVDTEPTGSQRNDAWIRRGVESTDTESDD